MNIKIVKEPNWFLEGYSLLKQLANHIKLSKATEEIEKTYEYDGDTWKKQKEFYLEVEENAKIMLEEKEEQIRYYFGIFEDTTGCLAELVDRSFLKDYIEGIVYFKENELPISCEQFTQYFGAHLAEFGSRVLDEDYSSISDPLEISHLIQQMPFSPEGKWHVQELFLNYKEHIRKIIELLIEAIEILKKSILKIEVISEEFYDYWTCFLKENNLLEYLKDILGIDLIKSYPNGILQPYFIFQTEIALFHSSQNDEDPICFNFGIMFNEIFMPNKKKPENNPETIFQILRCLSDRSKFDILTYIKDDWAYGSQIAKHMNLTTATISHHMSTLLENGLVEIKKKKDENRVYYHQNRKKLVEVLSYYEKLLE